MLNSIPDPNGTIRLNYFISCSEFFWNLIVKPKYINYQGTTYGKPPIIFPLRTICQVCNHIPYKTGGYPIENPCNISKINISLTQVGSKT